MSSPVIDRKNTESPDAGVENEAFSDDEEGPPLPPHSPPCDVTIHVEASGEDEEEEAGGGESGIGSADTAFSQPTSSATAEDAEGAKAWRESDLEEDEEEEEVENYLGNVVVPRRSVGGRPRRLGIVTPPVSTDESDIGSPPTARATYSPPPRRRRDDFRDKEKTRSRPQVGERGYSGGVGGEAEESPVLERPFHSPTPPADKQESGDKLQAVPEPQEGGQGSTEVDTEGEGSQAPESPGLDRSRFLSPERPQRASRDENKDKGGEGRMRKVSWGDQYGGRQLHTVMKAPEDDYFTDVEDLENQFHGDNGQGSDDEDTGLCMRRVPPNSGYNPPPPPVEQRRPTPILRSKFSSESLSSLDFSNSVASHVRKDSIALFTGKFPDHPLTRQQETRLQRLRIRAQKKLRSPKQELLRQYRLHIFVAIIFVVSVTFISCAWVYHNKARAELAKTQRIFFDPRQRTLTLSHPESGMVVGKLALDIPKWHLPLHCPIQEEGNPYSKECVWKRTAVLRVQHFSSEEILCYNISWENLKRDFVPYDCYDFGDALWYGPSNLSSSMLPIRGEFTFNPNVASVTDNGVFGTAVDYTWLSSTGGALVVTSDDPVRVEWNTTTPGKFCLISNYSAAFYNPESRGAPSLNYSLCNGPDMVTTYKFVREYFGSLNQHIAPDRAMMKLPQWSSKAEAKSRTVSEDDVVALATNLKKNGMNCSLLHVDGKWEAEYGDLSFDPDRFSNYSRLVEAVKGAGCEIALELSPFFDYRSPNFHEGVQRGYFVKDAGGRVTGMARWQHGVSGVLDITNPAARSWFTGYVTGLSANNQVSAFRWTYGNASWLPYQPHFNDHEENPSKVRRLYGEALASLNKKLVVEEASESQHLPAFISVQSSVVFQGDRGCLGPTIEHALSVSILGYPWLLADGFRVVDDKQSIHGGLPSRDVFIRWMQLAAFFPAVKYSLSPWSYDDFTVGVARNMSLLHQKVVLPILDSAAMTQDIQNGLPVLRPVWWAGPDDEDAHVVNDEFLIGGAMLIAPILCEGVERRDIFIPEGIWKDRLRESLVVGPKWLRNYKVELYEVAHFSFEHVYEKKPPKPKTTKIPL